MVQEVRIRTWVRRTAASETVRSLPSPTKHMVPHGATARSASRPAGAAPELSKIQDDDRTVLCFVTQTGGTRTGSVKDSKQ